MSGIKKAAFKQKIRPEIKIFPRTKFLGYLVPTNYTYHTYMYFIFYKFLFFISDFLEIQRKSFYFFINNKLSEEFSKINLLTNSKFYFFWKNFKFLKPTETIQECIILGKTYCCHFYLPVNFEIKKKKKKKMDFFGYTSTINT